MRQSKSKPFKGGKYAFVIDGENEHWYIQMLKRNENVRAGMSPVIPHRKGVSDQFNSVVEMAADYPKVFWIIDLDVLIKETREGIDRIGELQECLSKILSNPSLQGKVIPIINTPCLEFWFLLHLKDTSQYFDSCKKVISEIKRIAKAKDIPVLRDYVKSQEYYTKQNNDIYLRLRSYLQTAITNAAKLPAFNHEVYKAGLSEMDELFNHIEELKHLRPDKAK